MDYADKVSDNRVLQDVATLLCIYAERYGRCTQQPEGNKGVFVSKEGNGVKMTGRTLKTGTEVRVVKWGNSLAIRIPQSLAKQTKLGEGSLVELLTTTEGFRVKKRPEHPTLEELLARVTDENRHESVDWGFPVGNEIW